jgi:hypothetical protein
MVCHHKASLACCLLEAVVDTPIIACQLVDWLIHGCRDRPRERDSRRDERDHRRDDRDRDYRRDDRGGGRDDRRYGSSSRDRDYRDSREVSE